MKLTLRPIHTINAQTVDLPLTGALAVMGKSGEGKSTLLKALAGLTGKPHKSEFELFDFKWRSDDPDSPCVYVNDTFGLFPHWNVQKNLDKTYQHAGSPFKTKTTACSLKQVIDAFRLKPLLKKSIQAISGGETQRVLIARAMLSQKPILLLDEVFSGLDSAMKSLVFETLVKWTHQFNRRYVVVSHQLSDLEYLCRHALIIESGQLTTFDKFSQALTSYDNNPDHYFSKLSVEFCETDEKQGLHTYYLANSKYKVFKRIRAQELVDAASITHLQLPASSISLCSDEEVNISMLNKLPCRIVDMLPAASSQVVKLEVEGQELLAAISQKSAKHMALKKSQTVTLLFKAL